MKFKSTSDKLRISCRQSIGQGQDSQMQVLLRSQMTAIGEALEKTISIVII